ncbi:MAG: hypothetical protein AAFY03_07885, partial [Pseudomonadota bacterium]
MKVWDVAILVKAAVLVPGVAFAHVSQQGFVLLLPTDVYAIAGVAVVALTVVALFLLPGPALHRLFEARRGPQFSFSRLRPATSFLSFLLLSAMVYVGHFGPRDPLSNLMPLMFWTVGWIALVSLTGFLGNLWRAINPWSWLLAMVPSRDAGPAPGPLPGCLLLLAFSAFLLADPAPDDPARLARLAGFYWVAMSVLAIVAGPHWLERIEIGFVVSGAFGRLAPVGLSVGRFGTPGWNALEGSSWRGLSMVSLLLLGIGSFDGLNETFWWLGLIGVNPLEFPGRSAVIVPTLAGLFITNLALIAAYAIAI